MPTLLEIRTTCSMAHGTRFAERKWSTWQHSACDTTSTPCLTVRNVSALIHEKLKQRAKAHKRSLNGEVIELLEQAVLGDQSAAGPPRAVLDALQREQARTPVWNVRDEELRRAMREDLA